MLGKIKEVFKVELPLNPKRTRVFATEFAMAMGYQGTDIITTYLVLLNGHSEQNDIFEWIHPLLSPKFVAENYGVEGLLVQKVIAMPLMFGLLAGMRQTGTQEMAIWTMRTMNTTMAMVCIANILLANGTIK